MYSCLVYIPIWHKGLKYLQINKLVKMYARFWNAQNVQTIKIYHNKKY